MNDEPLDLNTMRARYDQPGYTWADAEFTAQAREDIPKLIAELETTRLARDHAILLASDYEQRWIKATTPPEQATP